MKWKKIEILILILLLANLLVTACKSSAGAGSMFGSEAKQIVNEICSHYVDGYTVQTGMGRWTDPSGNLVQKLTLIYSFMDVEEESVMKIMDEARSALNQSSILVEYSSSEYIYYEEGTVPGI